MGWVGSGHTMDQWTTLSYTQGGQKTGPFLRVDNFPTGNESVPKIIVNNKVNLFFKTANNILVISNHNSFRVLFDNIASVYFLGKNIIIS